MACTIKVFLSVKCLVHSLEVSKKESIANEASRSINDASRSVNDSSESVIDDARMELHIVASLMLVIYDHNMYIVQATSLRSGANVIRIFMAVSPDFSY
jgi:hypothetical protein